MLKEKFSNNTLIVIYAFFLPLSKAVGVFLSFVLLLKWLTDKNFFTTLNELFKNNLIRAISLFLIFSFISLFWSDNLLLGLEHFRRYWHFLLIGVFVTYIKEHNLQTILSAFLLGMLISEIFSFGIFFELISLKHGSVNNPSPFMHHIQYSIFLSLASLIVLNRFFFVEDIRFKIMYIVFFIITTSNLFLNGGRTGQLTFIISLFVLGFLNIKNKIYAFFSILIVTTTIVILAYNISPIFKNKFDQGNKEFSKLLNQEKGQYNDSIGLRIGAWMVSYEVFKDSPLLGTGIGSELEAIHAKIDHSMKEFESVKKLHHLHSNYVSFLVQLGFIGLLLYLSIFYYLYKLPVLKHEILNLKYIFISIFIISSFFDYLFVLQFPLTLFIMFCGIFIASTKFQSSENI